MRGQSPESHLLLQEKSCKEKYFAHALEFPGPFSDPGKPTLCLCKTGLYLLSLARRNWPQSLRPDSIAPQAPKEKELASFRLDMSRHAGRSLLRNGFPAVLRFRCICRLARRVPCQAA